MILDVLELLGVQIPLGVVGLGAELEPKVCSGHQLRLEGTSATGRGGGGVSSVPGSPRVSVTPSLGPISAFLNLLNFVHLKNLSRRTSGEIVSPL